jgi:hypothetical protein
MNHSSSDDKGLNRREFIKVAAAGSAMLATAGLPKFSEGAEPASTSRSRYAVLRDLPPGAIQPQGWMRAHLEAQAKLTTALGDIAYPFSYPYWEGMEDAKDWFQWEQRAYWIDGSVRLSLLLGDDTVMAKPRAAIDYTLSHPSSNGFLGPQMLEFSGGPRGPNRWPNTVLFRGLMALADARPAPEGVDGDAIADAMRKHYLNDEAPYANGGRNITNMEPLLWCYERTGDQRLLEMAEKWWTDYINGATAAEARLEKMSGQIRFHPYSDLAPSRVFSNTPAEGHGVSYAEQSKLPAILYLYTGKEDYVKYVVAAQRRVLDYHMLIDGIPSSQEGLSGTTALNEHETCDITDYPWSWSYVLMATGDGIWGDHIERACFNAHPGATRDDWKGIQYFSCPNQFLATLDCDPNSENPGTRRLAYQPNPAQYIGCCAGNKHRCVPNYVLRMWMKTSDNGLAATLYGPSKVTTKVGPANQLVQVTQKTNYPFEEEIRFEIKTDHPVAFPLLLRIPAWCDSPQIKVNGGSAHAERRTGFAVLHRSFKSGDVVTLSLPMKVKTTEWPENGIGIERGPLVYAMPIEAKWSSFPEAAYSSEEFPTWEANPVSEWNYGLAVDPARTSSQVEVKRASSPPDLTNNPWPWSSSPVTLTVPVRKIEGWELRSLPENPNPMKFTPENPSQRFTPPLPTPGQYNVGETVERVSLVPYGAAKLRLSIFPKIKA